MPQVLGIERYIPRPRSKGRYRKEAYCLPANRNTTKSPTNASMDCVGLMDGPLYRSITTSSNMNAMMKIIVALSTSILLGLNIATVVCMGFSPIFCSKESFAISLTSQQCHSGSSHRTHATLLLHLITEHTT